MYLYLSIYIYFSTLTLRRHLLEAPVGDVLELRQRFGELPPIERDLLSQGSGFSVRPGRWIIGYLEKEFQTLVARGRLYHDADKVDSGAPVRTAARLTRSAPAGLSEMEKVEPFAPNP